MNGDKDALKIHVSLYTVPRKQCKFTHDLLRRHCVFFTLPLSISRVLSTVTYTCPTAPDSAFKASLCASKASLNIQYHEKLHSVLFNAVKRRTEILCFCVMSLCLAGWKYGNGFLGRTWEEPRKPAILADALQWCIHDFISIWKFISIIYLLILCCNLTCFQLCLTKGLPALVRVKHRRNKISIKDCGSWGWERWRFSRYTLLEDTARYAGLPLAPAEGFGLWPRFFLPFGQKISFLCCLGPFLAIFGVQ